LIGYLRDFIDFLVLISDLTWTRQGTCPFMNYRITKVVENFLALPDGRNEWFAAKARRESFSFYLMQRFFQPDGGS
jgi:hypothetical protein